MNRRNVAWIVLGFSSACMAVAAAMADRNWPLRAIAFIGCAIILTTACGALIASRRPDNPVGWILAAIGLCFSFGFVATQVASRTLAGTDRPMIGLIAAWLESWVWIGLLALFPLVLLLFPTGHLPSPRWRWVARGAVACASAALLLGALRPGPFDPHPKVTNPLGLRPAGPAIRLLGEVVEPLFFLFAGAAAVSVLVRYRRSLGKERRQLKWFVLAVAIALVLAVTSQILPPIDLNFIVPGIRLNSSFVLLVVAFLLIPIAIAIAILRHRAFDIDQIVSRTVSYVLITALLGSAFALSVLLPTAVVGRSGRTPDYVIAIATLVVAALFQPVRRRVQKTIDRRFDRSRYDAQRTIESFAARLRQQVDLDMLGADVASVVQETMQPASISLWLRPGRA